ncbi:MAG: metal ABC transporter ATP-binding protein [Nanoarchaeota archaeon]|nr:metal ABC transporter ATP-binding protein [Nanoarchaeota archaeon]
MVKGDILSIKNLTFNYGAEKILDNVSFSIQRKDFLGIIGPNGSGKTTLLKLILGLLPVQKGSIKLLGQDIKKFNQWSKIGYVQQKAASFDPYFPASVKEVVSMGLIAGKRFPKLMTKQDDAIIDKCLKIVNMQKYENRKIGELSGGQQQRVFIARALTANPEMLILDEPTTGVDQETQSRFYKLLENLNKEENITVILISHDIGTITHYVTKVACLNQKLVFHGTHDEFCSSKIAQQFLTREKHLICHSH